jgi:hypothetical protein
VIKLDSSFERRTPSRFVEPTRDVAFLPLTQLELVRTIIQQNSFRLGQRTRGYSITRSTFLDITQSEPCPPVDPNPPAPLNVSSRSYDLSLTNRPQTLAGINSPALPSLQASESAQ